MLESLGDVVLATVQRDRCITATDDLLEGCCDQRRGGKAHDQCDPWCPGGDRSHQRLGRRHGQEPVAGAYGERQIVHTTSEGQVFGRGHDDLCRYRARGVVKDDVQFVERCCPRLFGRLHRTERALAVNHHSRGYRRPAKRKAQYPLGARAEDQRRN